MASIFDILEGLGNDRVAQFHSLESMCNDILGLLQSNNRVNKYQTTPIRMEILQAIFKGFKIPYVVYEGNIYIHRDREVLDTWYKGI